MRSEPTPDGVSVFPSAAKDLFSQEPLETSIRIDHRFEMRVVTAAIKILKNIPYVTNASHGNHVRPLCSIPSYLPISLFIGRLATVTCM